MLILGESGKLELIDDYSDSVRTIATDVKYAEPNDFEDEYTLILYNSGKVELRFSRDGSLLTTVANTKALKVGWMTNDAIFVEFDGGKSTLYSKKGVFICQL